MLKYYVCWLLLMSAVTFFLMGWDKHLARCRRRRIPERVLLGWAAAGGALGGILAMQLFRHKTLHRHFSVGMPVMLAVQDEPARHAAWVRLFHHENITDLNFHRCLL